ncbi:MAG: CBS domain-containing protein [Deltaproteobacteria bacterium]|nr:CBS domain-containing protein [Deltaproteobacteria bacterium]
MPIAKKVKDIMVPLSNYASVGADKSLRDAVLSLRREYCQIEEGKCTEAGHRSVLILDDAGRLVGVMDFRSILRVLIPEVAGGLTSYLGALGVSVAFAQADAAELDESRASFRARVLKNAEVRVTDVMLKVKGTITDETDLLEALKLMHRNKISMLPVYHGEKLVGVVRDSDLFLAVSDIFRE